MKKFCFLLLLSLGFPALIQNYILAADFDDTIYYTKVGLFYEKDGNSSAGHLKHTRIPPNTPVELLGMGRRHIRIRIPETSHVITIRASEWNSKPTEEIFRDVFSENTLNLDAYNPEKLDAIISGTVQKGMTRDEVLLTLGYPLRTETPTLNRNVWKYSIDKNHSISILYRDDRVVNIYTFYNRRITGSVSAGNYRQLNDLNTGSHSRGVFASGIR
ncbi:hypothetical protein JW979_05980 [bacterium]|nr:hypothetical protein [candidate division CSSED10-310 bacterium]